MTVIMVMLVGLAAAGSGYLLINRDHQPSTLPPPAAGPTGEPSRAAVPAPRLDATTVATRLAAAKLPITNLKTQDENSDPNDLLGRPNGYASRASFDVPGGDTDADPHSIDRGGVIEVWPDAISASARVKYIQDSLKALPALGTEYDYLNGPILVRITGHIRPSVAGQFATAVAALR